MRAYREAFPNANPKGKSNGVVRAYCSRMRVCGSLMPRQMRRYMRRAQAILVAVVLAALPLVLLAKPSDPPACDGMCCVRHATHSPRSGSSSQTEGMSCHHGAAGHMFQCGMSSKRHAPAVALLAPLPPTMLSSSVALPIPTLNRQSLAQSTQGIFPGFLSVPFEPPRT